MAEPTTTQLEQVKEGLCEVLGYEVYKDNCPSDRTIYDYLYGWTVEGTITCILRDYFKIEKPITEDEDQRLWESTLLADE
jgi:hypothetical protein